MGKSRTLRSKKVVESDEEDDASEHYRLSDGTRKAPTGSSTHSKQSSTHSTPQTTPEKPKSRKTAKQEPKKGARTLHTFFNAATKKQRERSKTPVIVQEQVTEEVEDDIDDGLSDKEPIVRKVSTQPVARLPSRKRSPDGGNSATAVTQNARKFFKATDGSKRDSTPVSAPPQDHDSRPWTERYAPRNIEELVVHNKKIADVRQWLTESLHGNKHRRLLVLKGAAGSGKTATLRTLAGSMDFEILEWQNPALLDFESSEYISLSSQFDDFLGRGRRFGGLDLVSDDLGVELQRSVNNDKTAKEDKPHVLLIEDFPSNLQRSSLASQSFRSSILQFLHTPSMASAPLAPLVMVISESLLSSSRASEDSFTAHRLLGPEILHHPGTAIIEFNVVAQTFIAKALSTILQKRSRDTGRYNAPHADVMKKLAEFGDVRNATSTLELLCTHTRVDGLVSEVSKVPTKGRSSKAGKKTDDGAAKSDRDAAMSVIALRESTIGLFHAVGKVVYNKRVDKTEDVDSLSRLPDHLSHHERALQSELDCDLLIDETGTDPSTFLSAIHENYLPSCTPADGNEEVALDVISGCLDALGDADLLSSLDSSRKPRYASAGEGLRQADLAFQVGVRGVLFNLPYPVKRQSVLGKGRGDTFRMYYPADLKLYKDREELRGSLQHLTSKAISGTLLETMESGQDVQREAISQPDRMPSERDHSNRAIQGEPENRLVTPLGSGHSASLEMLLERLPFVTRMSLHARVRPHIALVKQITRVVRFCGIRVAQDEEEEDSVGVFTNIPIRDTKTAGGLAFMGAATTQEDFADGTDAQNTVLIDDDIEDD